MVVINMLAIFFPLIAFSTAKSMQAKPNHQIAGFPMAAIVETKPLGKAETYSQTGLKIKGQVHHSDENGWVAVTVE